MTLIHSENDFAEGFKNISQCDADWKTTGFFGEVILMTLNTLLHSYVKIDRRI